MLARKPDRCRHPSETEHPMSRNDSERVRQPRRARLGVERLEGRALLSGIPPQIRAMIEAAPRARPKIVGGLVVAPRLPGLMLFQALSIQSSGFVTQQAGGLDVTVVRTGFAGPSAKPDAAAVNNPLTVMVSATVNPTSAQAHEFVVARS